MRFATDFEPEDIEFLIPWICIRATSTDPAGWSKHCPAHGQSDLIALLVHKHFGGEILSASVEHLPQLAHLHRHYWNRLPSRFHDDPPYEMDLSGKQRCGFSAALSATEVCAPEQLLQSENVAARMEKVQQLLAGLFSAKPLY